MLTLCVAVITVDQTGKITAQGEGGLARGECSRAAPYAICLGSTHDAMVMLYLQTGSIEWAQSAIALMHAGCECRQVIYNHAPRISLRGWTTCPARSSRSYATPRDSAYAWRRYLEGANARPMVCSVGIVRQYAVVKGCVAAA